MSYDHHAKGREQLLAGVGPEACSFPITSRSILVGAFCIALLALINPYLAYVRNTWEVGFGSLPSSAVLSLFLLVVVNSLLARLHSDRGLTRSELLVVYGMIIIPIYVIHTSGLPIVLSSTTYPFYRATPSNGWQSIIAPHIPLWLRLNDPQAVVWFWEGMPRGSALPWGVWLTPLASWGLFTLALATGVFCLGSLLNKDWIERQRLSYPLVAVPLALVGQEERPTLGASLLRNRVFWIGFAVPSLFVLLDFCHLFYPNLPAPQLYDIRLGPYFQGMGLPWSVFSGHWDIRLSITFSVIGISCLVPTEVSLSIWLFYVLYRLQQLAWASFGVTEGGGVAGVAVDPRLFIGFQEAGGFIALTAILLYQSRKAIRVAWLGLLRRAEPDPDRYSPLSGEWALLGFAVSNVIMFGWAMHAGMSWWSFALLLGLYYTVLVGCARLTAAAGVMYTDTGFFPRDVVVNACGALSLGPTSLTMLGYFSTIYTYDPNTVMMPQVMNSFKLLHSGRVEGRRFSEAALVSLIIALLVGAAALLWVSYHYGASTLRPAPMTSRASWAFSELDASLRSPQSPDNWLRLALGIGAAFTCLLVWLNARFLWWPVSPIGFLIASSYETNRSLWLNVFIAWLAVTLIRRYGGLRLFRSLRPIFLGLILGEFLPKGILGIIASLLGLVWHTSV